VILRLGAGQAARLLAWCVAALAAGHLGTGAVHYGLGFDRQLGLRPLLNLNGEANLPAWFSAALLLAAAAVLAVIWRTTPAGAGSGRRYWAVLAAVFVFLSADEAAEIHEMLNPLREHFGNGGLLYWAWVVPYGIAGLALVAAYARFLTRLPSRTARLFVASGVLYVGGALVLEMAGGMVMDRVGRGTLPVVALYTLEELAEMSAVVLFIYALLDYLAQRDGGFEVEVHSSAKGAAPGGVP
jgi:hypothetical protein